MNWKQIVCMWLGIGLIVLIAFASYMNFHVYSEIGIGPVVAECYRFGLWVFIVALVTGGLIYTFRDRKRPETEHPINITCGLTRLTLGLSLLSILFFFTIGIGLRLDSHQEAPELFAFAVGLSVAAGVWVIYALMRWILVPFVCWVVKGFHQDTG
jgi:hypothetical protein